MYHFLRAWRASIKASPQRTSPPYGAPSTLSPSRRWKMESRSRWISGIKKASQSATDYSEDSEYGKSPKPSNRNSRSTSGPDGRSESDDSEKNSSGAR